MNRTIFFRLAVAILLLHPLILHAQSTLQKTTYTFAQRPDADLKLDIYQIPSDEPTAKPCIVFVFGGGFKEGTRDNKIYDDFFRYFAAKNYTVASVDYRLGLKNIDKAPSPFNQKPLANAVSMAVEDLYAATAFLLENANRLHIDSTQIVVCGSSAGAITVLQADYEKRNSETSSAVLPREFQYAGVMAFAGAIYSTKGTPRYNIAPAPTLFFHGSIDKMVPYNRIRLFKKGLFGSKSLAANFKKSGYPYCFYSMEGIGHEVSEYPLKEYLPEIEQFILNFVVGGKRQYIDVNIKDDNRKPADNISPKEYYR